MAIESDGLGNGVIKPERLSVKYRGARRESSVPEQATSTAEPVRPESTPADGERRTAATGEHRTVVAADGPEPPEPVERLDVPADRLEPLVEPMVGDELTELGLTGGERDAVLSPLTLDGLTEPVFPPIGWPERTVEPAPLVEHPLLRGLLLELPPRGATPTPEWLDRWFEATRAILELLYAQPSSRRH